MYLFLQVHNMPIILYCPEYIAQVIQWTLGNATSKYHLVDWYSTVINWRQLCDNFLFPRRKRIMHRNMSYSGKWKRKSLGRKGHNDK